MPKFRDRQLDGAGPGVPVAVPIAVTRVRAFVAAFAVFGPADRVDLGGHQHVGEGFHHRPQ